MTLLLGLYWAVGSNLTLGPTQELTDGAGFSIGHQQMFGIFLSSKLAGAIAKKDAKKTAAGKGKDSVVYKWLAVNAGRYGFVNDVASEPWHWTWTQGKAMLLTGA